jgi:putative ABC transport system permease protein
MAMFYAFYFRETAPEQALRVMTRNRISLANVMPLSYRERIKQVPGVREVMVANWFGGTYKDSDFKNFFARFAIEPDRIFTMNPEYRVAEDQKRAFQQERRAALVGRPLAERFGWNIGNKVTIVGDIYPVTLEFTIRAIYDAPRDNENLFFHYDYLRESVSAGRRDQVSVFVVLADSPESVPRIASAIDEMFRNSPDQTRSESERAFELSFLNYLGNVKLFLLSVCAAVTFTLLLVSGNTMAMAVRERVREVGILKTLGFTPAALLGIILGEAVAIAVAGGVIGLLAAEGRRRLFLSTPGSYHVRGPEDLARAAIGRRRRPFVGCFHRRRQRFRARAERLPPLDPRLPEVRRLAPWPYPSPTTSATSSSARPRPS